MFGRERRVEEGKTCAKQWRCVYILVAHWKQNIHILLTKNVHDIIVREKNE